jgi:replicative DNA helicase
MKPQNIDLNIGKIPPQCCDIEEAVLGALMLEDCISEIDLKPVYFYKETHRKIFTAILNLSSNSSNIDILTVSQELNKLGWLEEIGGNYYISELTNKVSNASHIVDHSLIIIDKYFKRELISFSTQINNLAFDDSKDIDEILDYANNKLDEINNFSIDSDENPLSFLIKKSIEQLQERIKLHKEGKSIGIPSPLADLNKIIVGFLPKKLYLIASRPSMGKTALAISILKTAAKFGKNPCLFSLEMDGTEIADRILVGESNIDADNYRFGNIQNYEWMQLEMGISKLKGYNILIDDKPKSIQKIKSRAKYLKRKNKCDLLIIDYLQLMDSSDKTNNREQEIANISRTAKRITMELEIPVILLSQLNREVEKRPNKMPQLSDLRESGAIEQDADVVMFLMRPSYYKITEDENGNPLPNGYAILDIRKQRGGKIDIVEFKFNESLTNLFDLNFQEYLPSTNPVDINPNSRIEPNTNFEQETPF